MVRFRGQRSRQRKNDSFGLADDEELNHNILLVTVSASLGYELSSLSAARQLLSSRIGCKGQRRGR
jgi:hypothetical protein